MSDLALPPTNGKVDCKIIDYVEREQKRLMIWGVMLLVGFAAIMVANQFKALSLPGDEFGGIITALLLMLKDVTSNLKGSFKSLNSDKDTNP